MFRLKIRRIRTAGWIGILLCTLLLTACGIGRDSLRICEQVLINFQNAESCRINSYSTSSGQLSQGSPRNRYWKNGEDWMQIRNAGDSVFAYLYREGIYYDNIATGGVENGHILWNTGADRGNQKPWLLEFQWDAEKLELIGRSKDEEGTHIQLKIAEPFIRGDASADSYTVEFTFNRDGSFSNVRLNAVLVERNGNTRPLEEIHFGSTQNEDQIAREMDVAFGSKITPLQSSKNGCEIAYGGLSMTLPQGYTCREGSTGLLLLKEGLVSGGITHWNVHGEDEDWLNSLGLWDVMSGASYMVSYWENVVYASFVNEFDPASMNHDHQFYIQGSIVYNVWVDENLITREEASELWATLDISDQLPEPETAEVPLVNLSRLPEGYRCEAEENGNLVIINGGTVIGGVDIYPIPDGAMDTYDPYYRWLESLGIPDFEDETLCYSGGSSPYGNWERHFESDLPPGQEGNVSRYHTFYVGVTQVWDVWFDLMVIDRTTMDTLLDTLTVQ